MVTGSKRQIVRTAIIILAVAMLATRLARAEVSPDEEWFLMYKGDAPIGYTYARVTPLPAPEEGPRLIEIDSEIWIR
ncbi:MAG: hypothetical protein ABIH66_02225, partial [bacterium]